MNRLRLVALLLAVVSPVGAADWHHPLDLDGGGVWRQRIAVTVDNGTDRTLNGRPVALAIGTAPGAAALVGAKAESVRVCDLKGEEMLFALADPAGRPQPRGPLAAGSALTIPVECAGRASTTYYVYFDNPAAGELPDFLVSARLGLVNGGLELGTGTAPTGWDHDEQDAQHQTAWVSEHPQAGAKCLETIVSEGAEPSWISTRQRHIPIVGGARYVMTAWVRAAKVKGQAGWYIHVGNRDNPMIVSPMLNGGEGTFGWKQVSAEFTAPAEADVADLGTVLRGSGTAWFDSVTLTCLDPPKVRAVAAPPERLSVREVKASPYWPVRGDVGHRAVVRVVNLRPEPIGPTLVCIDASAITARARGRFDPHSVWVDIGGSSVSAVVAGDRILFPASIAGQSVATYHVYYSNTEPGKTATAQPAASPVAHNLVKNAGFENARGGLPDGWRNSGPSASEGVSFGLDDPGRPDLGRRAARMTVAATAPQAWRGWHQDVPVKPGHTYLISAWIKCADVKGGELTLNAHRHKASGQLVDQEPMLAIGSPIGGTTGWTLMSGLSTMPADAASLELHLTMNHTGTVWHDGIVVAEIAPAKLVGLEHREEQLPAGRIAAWPVPAVVKVFPDDVPPAAPVAARVSAAANEREPLQLALRASQAFRGVRIEVDPPTGSGGARLSDVKVGVVGYVPIDAPTNYYQSKTPAWHRKYPTGGGSSDGWAGLWPDPLLPRASVDLAPGRTQPVWVTVGVPKDAPAGDFRGTVRLVQSDGQALASVPFTVHVWSFALPDRAHVKAIYDIGLGEGGEALWKVSHRQAYGQIAPFMGQNRLSPDRINPDPNFSYRDGKATADFAAFDAAATRYFDDWKIPHSYMPNLFYMFGWGFPPKDIFGEKPFAGDPPFESADRSVLRPEYKAAYQACLRLFWDHVKAKGWQDRFVLYISDEPFYDRAPIRTQMVSLCKMIHEVDPKIPIYSSTWHHVPEWDGSLDIWGIGHYGVVPVEQMAKIRAGGAKIWFTTDGHMCTDTPYCAIERMLPYFCFQYGAEAYEFWGVAWLTYDPYRFGWHAYIHQTDAPGQSYWVRYPNGDGFLLYPGAPVGVTGPVSSIRFEQAREGVEDHEYLVLLRDRAAKARAAGQPTAQADAALAAIAKLVPIPNAGGRYSTKLLPDPHVLFDVREQVARAIEALK